MLGLWNVDPWEDRPRRRKLGPMCPCMGRSGPHWRFLLHSQRKVKSSLPQYLCPKVTGPDNHELKPLRLSGNKPSLLTPVTQQSDPQVTPERGPQAWQVTEQDPEQAWQSYGVLRECCCVGSQEKTPGVQVTHEAMAVPCPLGMVSSQSPSTGRAGGQQSQNRFWMVWRFATIMLSFQVTLNRHLG